jgi:hypothetical protein
MWVFLHIIYFAFSWTLRFLIMNSRSTAFDAEVYFSWRWMCQDSRDCWCLPRFCFVPFFFPSVWFLFIYLYSFFSWLLIFSPLL